MMLFLFVFLVVVAVGGIYCLFAYSAMLEDIIVQQDETPEIK